MNGQEELDNSQNFHLSLNTAPTAENLKLLTPEEENIVFCGSESEIAEKQVFTPDENLQKQVSIKSLEEQNFETELQKQVSDEVKNLEKQVFTQNSEKTNSAKEPQEQVSSQVENPEKRVSSETKNIFTEFEMAPIQPITLHPFTPHNINMWLKLVKCKLKAHGVEDEDLFKRIRMDMPLEIAERIPELMDPEPTNDNFQYFENKLKEVFGKTREQDIRELLNKLSLNDDGPRRLMDQMIERAGTDISALVIADLFRQKLPKEVARLLVSLNNTEVKTQEDLKNLADTAEKVHQFEKHYTSPNKVSAISSNNNMELDRSNDSLQKRVIDLENEVSYLKRVVNNLLDNKSDKNSNNNNSGGRKSRPRSSNRSSRSGSIPRVDYSKPENEGKCKYHILYGNKAFHCTLPCTESGKPLAEKPKKEKSNSGNQGNSNAKQ